MLCHISAHPSHGKFHGSKFVLGVVAQQFQFRGTQVQERGKSDAFSICVIISIYIKKNFCYVNVYVSVYVCVCQSMLLKQRKNLNVSNSLRTSLVFAINSKKTKKNLSITFLNL